MTDEIVGPVLLDGDGDTEVWESAAALCGFLEVFDLRLLEVFDVDGRRLELAADGYRVLLSRPADSLPDPEVVDRLVRREARALGEQRLGRTDIETADPHELIDAILDFNRRVRENAGIRPKLRALSARLRRSHPSD